MGQWSRTDGTISIMIDNCPYCNLSTNGNHEAHCPMAGQPTQFDNRPPDRTYFEEEEEGD